MKKGFTLIELMVVIVIIGILAAIAVPKMFGMSAKAKASEVSPAAGTYSKLQQAYFTEIASIGAWASIGYTAPGGGQTNNFTYTEVTTTAADGVHFNAEARIDLNGCASGTDWQMTTVAATGVSTAVNPASSTCVALIPNFAQVGK